MESRLLGEVELWAAGQLLDVRAPRQQAVLAALAVDAGRPVAIERLIDRVWNDTPPAEARNVLYSHLSRIRRLLRQASVAGETAVRIERRHAGYVLDVDPDLVDLHRFHRLVDQGRDQQRGDADRAAAIAEALGLWRGPPLAGIPGEWAAQVRDSWHRQRLDAVVQWAQLELQLGRPAAVITTVPDLTVEYPLVEPLEILLMRALHTAGRGAEAVDRYTAIRRRLADELGIDPGPELRAVHQAMLHGEPPPPSPKPMVVAVRTALPALPRSFTGRTQELAALSAALDTAAESGGTVVISAIAGAGGMGKTWLALYWAHQNMDRFPDGQLFVDLRGFSPTGRPAHPVEVLGGFLEALGVDRDRQPTDQDHRAELYRSLVAGKRMLVVLDNAATTDQVTPLLPGDRRCTVVVTSRNHLRGFIARHGARPVHLDVLTDTEAHTLLAAALGPDRAATDKPAIAELIELCGGFPLALGLIAARAATDPHLPLSDTAAELRTLGLDALDSEDPTASLPMVLSWSLRHLTDQHRTVFALLSIAPGPDIGRPAAACVTGLPEREAHAVLRTLVDDSPIDRTPGGRYDMHDLVRAYATTVADDLPAETRKASLRRVLDFYTHTAHAADRLLDPHRDLLRLDPPAPGVHLHPLPDAEAALAWFDTEHACLLAAQHIATTLAWHSTVWHLAWDLYTYHYWRGHRHDRLTMCQAAADAATHLPDPTTRTRTHLILGLAHLSLGHHEDATTHLHHAVTLAEHQHDSTFQARTRYALSRAWEQWGDDRQALDHARYALDLHRRLDQPVWEARALNVMGRCSARLGDYDTARNHCQAALTLNRLHRHPGGEAAALDSLGYIDHHSGHHAQAIDHYHHALTMRRDIGNTYEVAGTLDRLGHPHATLGQHEQARAVWQEALQLYQAQHRTTDAERVQQQLDALDTMDLPIGPQQGHSDSSDI